MIPVDTAFVFVLASVALAFAPGPDNIFVLTQSALHGRSAGLLVTLGLCTGVVAHTMAVALGVAVLFATSAVLFNGLKIVGALYLLYLAWGAFRAGASDFSARRSASLNTRELYFRGVIMNITNPKVAIFFLAFLPQFADPSRGALSFQLLMLGAVFILVTLVVFGLIAWFAGYLGEWLQRSPKVQRSMQWAAGTVFVGLALRLATVQRN